MFNRSTRRTACAIGPHGGAGITGITGIMAVIYPAVMVLRLQNLILLEHAGIAHNSLYVSAMSCARNATPCFVSIMQCFLPAMPCFMPSILCLIPVLPAMPCGPTCHFFIRATTHTVRLYNPQFKLCKFLKQIVQIFKAQRYYKHN